MDREAQAAVRLQSVCLMILAAVAVGFVLVWFRNVLIPFVLAVFIANGLGLVSDFLMARVRLPRLVAVAVTLLLGVALLAALGTIVSTSIRELANNVGTYQRQIEVLVDETLASEWVQRLELGATSAQDLRALLPINRLGPLLLGTTNAILDVVGKGVIVLVFLVFLLMGEGAPQAGTRHEMQSRVRRYIAVQTALSAATGILVGGVLAALGVPLATVFGLCAFLLNFIPSIGSIVATLLPLPVILVSPEVSTTAAVLAIVLPTLVQVGIGNFVSPLVMGDSLDLHPVTILLALMVWGALWGVVGMLLATPITAIVRLLCQRLEITQPIADLLAGRPGESASQRLRPDEATPSA